MDFTSLATTQYIFPILRHSDILQCMSELNIELTKAELVEPARHKDRIRKVFLLILEACGGVTEEDLKQISPRMRETLQDICQYPQIHEEFESVRFFWHLKKFMSVCGVMDFGWKDLIVPTAKRFRVQLSAAINMAKFREDQLKLYVELNEPRTELIMALEEVTEENLQLNEQLTIVQRESHDLNKEMEEVEHECEELEIEIARNNKLQSAKREEATEWKKKHTDLQNELATAKLALQEKHIELENLQTKLVSSPERHTQNVKDLQSALKKVRKDGNQLEEEWQRIKTISVHISQAIKDVPIVTRQLRQLVDNCNRISHIRDDITKTKSEKETLSQLTSDVNEKIQSLEASHNRSEEKLQHTRKQYKLKMDAAQEALDNAKLRLLQVDQEQSEGMARVEAGEAELKALEQQFDQERCRTDQEIEEMMQIYSAMERKVLNEHISFMDALQIA